VVVIKINDLQTNGIGRKQFLGGTKIKTSFYFLGSSWDRGEAIGAPT
jgi:hypothetical protein